MGTLHIFRLYLILVGFVLLSEMNAQNLVPNPSFEVQDTCPALGDIELANPWFTANLGTPDLFNSTCSSQNSPARTGIGSAGIICYKFPHVREYLQVPLTQSLTQGQMYHVSFWVQRVDYYYATSNFGVYFSNGPYFYNTTSGLQETPQVANPVGNVITGTSWSQISRYFGAMGGEDHLILGNFVSDYDMNLVGVNFLSTIDMAYYRVDDISVTATQVGIEEFGTKGLTWGTSPAGDRVWVSMSGALEGAQPFSLYDMDGRMVPITTERSGADRYYIIPNAPVTGIYVLRVRSGSETRVAKVIFQPY